MAVIGGQVFKVVLSKCFSGLLVVFIKNIKYWAFFVSCLLFPLVHKDPQALTVSLQCQSGQRIVF